jgi:hypothetical protein
MLASELLPWKSISKEANKMNAITKNLKSDFGTVLSPVDSAFGGMGSGDAPVAAVPLKPSAAMLAEGARAGGVTVETAWKIYQAMLRCSR